MEIGKYKNKNIIIKMSVIRIPKVSDFIYLGLPIGDTLAFLYKQFCQSIFIYGLDNLFVNNNQLLN